MAKKDDARHPLSERHFRQIICRSSSRRAKMLPIWAASWRPGGNSGSFLNNLFRPIGSPLMMVQVSYPREGGREGIALFGIAAQIDPQRAVVSYDELRLKHDFHRVPFVGAGGVVLDPSDEGTSRRGNGSWVQLGLEADRLRLRAATSNYRLPAIPSLPQTYYGYGQKESAKFEVTPALRQRAAAELDVEWTGNSLKDLGQFDAEVAVAQDRLFSALPEETQAERLRTAWEAAFISPSDLANATRLWLFPHALSTNVYGATRVFEYFGDLVGAHVFNPARTLGDVSVPNPAIEVAKEVGVDLPSDLALLAQTQQGLVEFGTIEERLVGLIPAFRERAGASTVLSDQDLLHALCQYDQPVAIVPPLDSLAENEQIQAMRGALKQHISACCTDDDLLNAARNPHEPLLASGLCRMQTLHRRLRVPLDSALTFSSQALQRERVQACLWHETWQGAGDKNVSGTRLAMQAA